MMLHTKYYVFILLFMAVEIIYLAKSTDIETETEIDDTISIVETFCDELDQNNNYMYSELVSVNEIGNQQTPSTDEDSNLGSKRKRKSYELWSPSEIQLLSKARKCFGPKWDTIQLFFKKNDIHRFTKTMMQQKYDRIKKDKENIYAAFAYSDSTQELEETDCTLNTSQCYQESTQIVKKLLKKGQLDCKAFLEELKKTGFQKAKDTDRALWSDKEIDALKSACNNHSGRNKWKKIKDEFEQQTHSERTMDSLARKYCRIVSENNEIRNIDCKLWTTEEHDALLLARKNSKNWKEIKAEFERLTQNSDRSLMSLKYKYRIIAKSETSLNNYKLWTEKEEEALAAAYKKVYSTDEKVSCEKIKAEFDKQTNTNYRTSDSLKNKHFKMSLQQYDTIEQQTENTDVTVHDYQMNKHDDNYSSVEYKTNFKRQSGGNKGTQNSMNYVQATSNSHKEKNVNHNKEDLQHFQNNQKYIIAKRTLPSELCFTDKLCPSSIIVSNSAEEINGKYELKNNIEFGNYYVKVDNPSYQIYGVETHKEINWFFIKNHAQRNTNLHPIAPQSGLMLTDGFHFEGVQNIVKMEDDVGTTRRNFFKSQNGCPLWIMVSNSVEEINGKYELKHNVEFGNYYVKADNPAYEIYVGEKNKETYWFFVKKTGANSCDHIYQHVMLGTDLNSIVPHSGWIMTDEFDGDNYANYLPEIEYLNLKYSPFDTVQPKGDNEDEIFLFKPPDTIQVYDAPEEMNGMYSKHYDENYDDYYKKEDSGYQFYLCAWNGKKYWYLSNEISNGVYQDIYHIAEAKAFSSASKNEFTLKHSPDLKESDKEYKNFSPKVEYDNLEAKYRALNRINFNEDVTVTKESSYEKYMKVNISKKKKISASAAKTSKNENESKKQGLHPSDECVFKNLDKLEIVDAPEDMNGIYNRVSDCEGGGDENDYYQKKEESTYEFYSCTWNGKTFWYLAEAKKRGNIIAYAHIYETEADVLPKKTFTLHVTSDYEQNNKYKSFSPKVNYVE